MYRSRPDHTSRRCSSLGCKLFQGPTAASFTFRDRRIGCAKRAQARLSYVTKRVQTTATLVADIRGVTKHTLARRGRAVRSTRIGACMAGEPSTATLAN